MGKELKSVHRIQTPDSGLNPITNKAVPVRRILLSKNGFIKFNPNENNYVYLSRTDRHHCYYIFNKVMDIINDNLEFARQNPEFKNAQIPSDFKLPHLFYDVSLSTIKDVQHFFSCYLPPQYVELVSLKYMYSFGELVEKCKVKNQEKDKEDKLIPEVSDTTRYGGAYGLSDYWLELLKDCTLSSKTAKISVDKFLDFVIDVAPEAKAKNVSFRSIMTGGSSLINLLEYVSYQQLSNPTFYDKNNSNRIISCLQAIDDYHAYNKKKELRGPFWAKAKKEFKSEYHELTK